MQESIDTQLALIKQSLINIGGTLLELKDGQLKQNGRVGKLELWRSYLAGSVVTLIAFGAIDIFTNLF